MIKIANVHKEYVSLNKRRTCVLENIELEIKEGEVIALLGHNGSGKSTLLKCICGVLKPTSGEVLIEEKNSFKYRKQLIKNMGVIFNQKSSFIIDLSVSDNLKFFKAIYNLSDNTYEKNFNYLNSFLDINELLEKPYRKLSFGERVKCEIISILLHDPKYIILDEPTIGLDYNAKKGLYNLINELKKNGKSIIITTHEVDYIEGVCDKTVILKNGRIAYCGNPKAVTDKIGLNKKIIISYTDILDQNKAILFSKKCHEINENSLILFLSHANEFDDIVKEALEAYKVSSINVEEINIREVLEDVLSQGN
ncbi:ATP-binding cassette domain-containing protein [Acetivibrio ethanolgignens]|uniref:ABC transporter domain-containing protein n=1 Tax=Acetivibrio ethanolgignens TaxID=290052 RepID=A0A0V8QIM1_9FIRM|nr:ATP-binding cassette domain-containing protein [Acetivibrio ethanolgignens]KSV58275.1 hypothetical protein ASU35_13265 [Acetivibrio ethanolgignens]KSV60243.1 hypothetical protein ASU35_17155 [Acetivibrio ethanolgignens]